jgi:class 3 adenylate cyclase/pimeloyl-ACP methyl ester carboxylesterase
MAAVPRTRYAKSGDISVAYQMHGDGPIDLVMASGFFSHLEVMWEWAEAADFFRRLGSFARVIRFDRRGTGLSTRRVSSAPIEERMDDLRAVMDAAGSDRAALYGWSEGAALSAVCAASHPERVTALIVQDLFARVQSSDDFEFGDSMSETEVAALVAGWGTGAALERVAPSRADDDAFRAWFGRLQRFSVSPGDLPSLIEATYEVDVRAVLPTVRVPTLYLHRGYEQSLKEAEWTVAQIPDARFRHFEGSTALPYIDHEAFVDEIREFLTGARGGTITDRMLATVLFTDIVGSTERAAALGDRRWKQLLEEHHQLVRRQLVAHRGTELDTAGDGFLATFDGPARAIGCARAVVESVRSLGLEIRAGVHTGEVERHGDTIAGMAVHIGARVGAMAGASEVLVSSTVRDLAVGSDFSFADRGAHALKGVPGEWRVFAVT